MHLFSPTILKRCLILVAWGSASILGVACKRQQTEALDGTEAKKSYKPGQGLVNSTDDTTASAGMPAVSRDEVAGSVPIARSMLRKLPPIVDGRRVDERFLAKAGVPSAATSAVGGSAVKAYQSAKELMKKSTASLRFDLETRVEIEPLTVVQLDSIVNDFKSDISPLVAPELTEFLVNRFALQLQDEFGLKMWATLKRTGMMSLSDLRLPLELRGLSFLIETQKAEGTVDCVYVSPSAPAYQESKRYFFLKVPDGVTGGKAVPSKPN